VMSIITLLNTMLLTTRDHNTFITSFTNDLTCIKNELLQSKHVPTVRTLN